MTKYGKSPWVDLFPRSRVPAYPRFRGSMTTDIAIVGGGLTGCAAAYAFAAAGIRVVLVEQGQIGRGSSGSSSGWISDDPGVNFGALEQALGLRPARRACRAWHRAALDFGALVRRLGLKCEFEPRGALLIAATPDQLARLRKEQKARRDGGFEAPVVSGRVVASEAAVTAIAAIRSRDGATLDPYRAALGLA